METNGDDLRKPLGNTEPAADANKDRKQYIYWSFTWNEYTLSAVEIIFEVFKHECSWIIMQEEVGDSGNRHIQGTMKFAKRKRLTELKKFHNKIHWEATIQITASCAYCSSVEKRRGKLWTHGIVIPEKEIVNDFIPYGWQLEVMDIIAKPPDPRVINWFWEPDGGVGKTELAIYLYDKHDAMYCCGKAADIFHIISKQKNRRYIFIFDITKEKMEHFHYSTIEQIKNGLIVSGKYDSDIIRLPVRPHIFVFANSPPDINKLATNGRWNIIKIETVQPDQRNGNRTLYEELNIY